MPTVSQVQTGIWVYIFAFWAVLLVFQAYAPSANQFLHTYQIQPVGNLVSQRGSFSFVVSASFVFLWTIPITMAFALYTQNPNSKWKQIFHLGVTVVLALWLMAIFIYGCVDWANANKTDVSNYFNPANDPRWCCVHYSLSGAPCANSVACPGVTATDFVTNKLFLFQHWFGFVFLLISVLDIGLTLGLVIPTFSDPKNYDTIMVDTDNDQNDLVEGLIPQDKIRVRRPAYKYK